jgi:UDP-2,3-diacylglucosamine hydrolase
MQPALARLAGADRALLCSDMHLGDHDPATAEWFLEALQREAGGATHLFLLGDLFEAWVGDDQRDDVCERTIALLARIASAGVRVLAMRGNRDFLLDRGATAGDRGFASRAGATMLDDPAVVEFFGRRVLLAHGDALCIDDREYQAFRILTRDATWQAEFLGRPLPERIAIARGLRTRSETEKRGKPEALMDANTDEVARQMTVAGVTVMIHGHTHRPATHRFALGKATAERRVLSDWDAARHRGGFLAIDADGWREIAVE